MHKRFLIIIITLLLISGIRAQNHFEYYNYIHYTPEQGLPHSLTFDIDQSSDGFLWIASNNGLARFDGYDFKVFRPQVMKKNGIDGKSISQMRLDNFKNLWVCTQGKGISKMNLETEEFVNFSPKSVDSLKISGNDIFSLLIGLDSSFWIGTNKGIDYYNYKKGRFEPCLTNAPDNMLSIRMLCDDTQNRVWFLTANGNLGWFDKNQRSYKKPSDLIASTILDTLQITSIGLNDGVNLWLSTQSGGLIWLDLNTHELHFACKQHHNAANLYLSKSGNVYFISQSQQSILVVFDKKLGICKELYRFKKNARIGWLDFVEDEDGNVWISSEEGLFKIGIDNSLFVIRSKMGDHSDLLKANIHCRFIDNMGNLWLSSERNGIVMIDLHQKRFNQYKSFVQNKVMSGDNISVVFEDSNGQIWTGCYGEGLSCYNPKTQKSKVISYHPTDKNKMLFKAPAAIVEDQLGAIWIGFYDGDLVKTDKQLSKLEYFSPNASDSNHYMRGSIIRSMSVDKDNNVWISTNYSGIVEFNRKDNRFIYHSELYEPDFHSNSHYRTVLATNNGVVWFGTQNGGLGKYIIGSHQFKHFMHKDDDAKSIAGNVVYHIYPENDTVLWLATDKGLSRFDICNEVATNFSFVDNDAICGIYRVLPDKIGNFWMSGDCGIIKFNRTDHSYVKYIKSDGLPSTEYNTTAGCLTASGEMFFGWPYGLVSFNPKEIEPSPYTSKPALTALKIFNKEVAPKDTLFGEVVLSRSISLSEGIVLSHNSNDFTLEFSAMHFASPNKNQYFYYLENFNNNWIQANSFKRYASYTGLPPGVYYFHLKSTNNDGVVCSPKDEVVFKIEIKPSFFQSWFFRIAFILVLGITVLLIFLIRIHSIRRQKDVLERTVELRTTELFQKNCILEERQEEINEKNKELEHHKSHLEELVDERTKELLNALFKAEETDRLKSAFLANMSHEIRTPMNAIVGFSSLLIDDSITNEEKNQYAEIILSNGEALLNLLNDILDRSIIESGRMTLNKREVELNKLIQEIYLVFVNHSMVKDNKALKINLKTPENVSPIINTDPVRLSQVLNNLIGNAIKFTPQGTVDISYTLEGNYIKFTIQDTGIGMAPEMTEMVFERFHKIENPDIAYHRGAGLGLSICKSIVEMMGGTIWAESELNKGSSFHFTIRL